MSADAFKLAVRINLEQNLTRILPLIGAAFGKVSKSAVDLQKQLDKINRSFANMSGVDQAARRLDGFGQQASRMAQRYEQQANRVISSNRAIQASMPKNVPALNAGSGGRGTGAGGAVAGAAASGRRFPAYPYSGGFVAGYELQSAGRTLMAGAMSTVDYAKEAERAEIRLEAMKLGANVESAAKEFAKQNETFGANYTTMLDAFSETVGVFGPQMPLMEKLKNARKMAELNAANADLFGIKGDIKQIVKAADIAGLTNNSQEFWNFMDIATKIKIASGGMVDDRTIGLAYKHGGVAFKTMSDEGKFLFSSFLQERGASAATQLSAAVQNIVAGRMTNQAKHQWAELGLGKYRMVLAGENGGKKTKTAAFEIDPKIRKAFLENAPQAIIDHVAPALRKKYGENMSDTDIYMAVNKMLSNPRGSDLVASFITQIEQAYRDKMLGQKSMGVNEVLGRYKESNVGKLREFETQMDNLKLELGKGLLPLLVEGVSKLNKALEPTLAFFREHAEFTKWATGITLVGGALAWLGGKVLTLVEMLGALGLVKAGTVAAGAAVAPAVPAAGSAWLGGAAGAGTVAAQKVGLLGAVGGAAGGAAGLGVAGASLAAGLGWGFNAYQAYQAWKWSEYTGGENTLKLAERMRKLSPEEKARLAAMDGDRNTVTVNPYQTRQSSVVQVNPAHVMMDGRKVGEIVFKRGANEMARPSSGAPVYDPFTTALPVGLELAR